MNNQKKYEEAAKEHYPDVRLNVWEGARAGFVAGASFAEKEGWNAAIEKAVENISESADSDGMILRYWPIFKDELEKLKL
jgi:hypothetical protein